MKVKITGTGHADIFDSSVTSIVGTVIGGGRYLHTVGIDPGSKNIGLTQLKGNAFHSWQIELPKNLNTPRRVKELYRVLCGMHETWGLEEDYQYVVVERASYGSVGLQGDLAECRAICCHWFMEHGTDASKVIMVSPMTVRKQVFGSGKTRAEDVFMEMAVKGLDKAYHLDAASSLAIAMYGTPYHVDMES